MGGGNERIEEVIGRKYSHYYNEDTLFFAFSIDCIST